METDTYQVHEITENHLLKDENDRVKDRSFLYVLVILMEIFGFLVLSLVLIWTLKYMNGLSFDVTTKEIFNLHPILMITGMVFLYGNGKRQPRTQCFLPFLYADAAVTFRVIPKKKRSKAKSLHAFTNFVIILLTGCGFVPVFKFYSYNKISHFYWIHSWLGLVTIMLFVLQFVLGFVAFIFPKFVAVRRRKLLTIHRYFGASIFCCAIFTCLTGVTEKLWISDDVKRYHIGLRLTGNAIGMIILCYFFLVGYILYNPRFRKTIEEDVN